MRECTKEFPGMGWSIGLAGRGVEPGGWWRDGGCVV